MQYVRNVQYAGKIVHKIANNTEQYLKQNHHGVYNISIYYGQYGQQYWLILCTINIINCTQHCHHICQYMLKYFSKHSLKLFSILLNIFGYCSYCTYCTSYNLLYVLFNIIQYMPVLFNICQSCSPLLYPPPDRLLSPPAPAGAWRPRVGALQRVPPGARAGRLGD